MTTSISNNISAGTVLAGLILVAALALSCVCLVNLVRSITVSPRMLAFGLIVCLAVAGLCAFYLLHGRTVSPLFEQNSGTGEEQHYFAGSADGTVRIRVSENRIFIGDTACRDAEDLSDRLLTIDTSKDPQIILIDDYAEASAYHQAEEALRALGVTWTEEQLP
ncbi:MAG: hypothetical protein K6G16_08025 [Lachnospiraceae bacterium]|nr:hypothetical protein [Lachnospiraceae bacterium]